MKQCKICKESLPLDKFYKHKQTKDGYSPYCKKCTKEKASNNYYKNKSNPEYVWRIRNRNRERIKKLREKGINPYPSKSDSRNKYCKKACRATRCMKKKIGYNLHHWSYNDEHLTDVIELEIKDHRKIHSYMILDEELALFRTVHGELLDTREKSEEYYKRVLSLDGYPYLPDCLKDIYKKLTEQKD